MRYIAKIEVFENPKNISDCLGPEMRSLDSDRSSTKISVKKNSLFVAVEASDSVALRAALNAITKLFTVYEQASLLK